VCVCVRCSFVFSASSWSLFDCNHHVDYRLLFWFLFSCFCSPFSLPPLLAPKKYFKCSSFFFSRIARSINFVYVLVLQCCQHYSGDAAPHILHLCRRQSALSPPPHHHPRLCPSAIMATATVALPTSQSTFSLLPSQFVIIAMGEIEVQSMY